MKESHVNMYVDGNKFALNIFWDFVDILSTTSLSALYANTPTEVSLEHQILIVAAADLWVWPLLIFMYSAHVYTCTYMYAQVD